MAWSGRTVVNAVLFIALSIQLNPRVTKDGEEMAGFEIADSK